MYFQQISSRCFFKKVSQPGIFHHWQMNPSPKKKQKKQNAFRIGQRRLHHRVAIPPEVLGRHVLIHNDMLPRHFPHLSSQWSLQGEMLDSLRPALSQTNSHFATEKRAETQNECSLFSIIQIFRIYLYIYDIMLVLRSCSSTLAMQVSCGAWSPTWPRWGRSLCMHGWDLWQGGRAPCCPANQ